MSDNVAITAGTGTTVAADEVVDATLGTVKAQFVKVMDGTLDSTNKLIVSSSGAANVAMKDSLSQAQYNFPAGFVRTTDEPRQIAHDPFDAALDTTNFWTTPTVGNSAVLASVTTGTMSMGTGTTASGWSKLFTIPTFKPTVPAWIGYSFAIALPDGAAPTANSYRFWGAGTIATTPTTAAPMTDAVGFELTTAGKLVAVVYAGGVRTQVADLSGGNGQVLDAAMHRYIVYIRTDKAFWYIDGLTTQVATSSFQAPQVQTLPLALLAVGGSTPPVSNTQIQCSGLAVWDTGKNTTQISDGTFPWRRATVSAAGALSVLPASGSTTVVTQPTGTNLHAVIDTGSTTAVTQATGSNLHAVLDTGSTTSVTQATGTNLHTVVDSGTITAVTSLTNALPVGANVIGKVSIDQTTLGTTNAVQTLTGSTTAVTQATGTNLHTVVDSGTITTVSTVTAVTAITNALPTGTNTLGSVKITDGTTAAIINSSANQAAATANGAMIVEKGPRWKVTSTPAVSAQASASKAAIASTRHVCDSITFSAGATTAPALTKLNINVRDGATGAGTIIWSYTVVIPAATGQSVPPITVTGLNLVGSINTAMTIEFSALVTNLFEDVSISGYDVT